MSGWIGVDLDGTLAEYHSKQFPEIGKPIPAMVERVKKWLAEGKDVRIMTARVSAWDWVEQTNRIDAWCSEHIGQPLLVTASKNFQMEELWDDRAVSVEKNTGRCTTEGRE